MKRILFISAIVLLTACTKDGLDSAREKAERHWCGKKNYRIENVERISTDALDYVFKDKAIFRVVVTPSFDCHKGPQSLFFTMIANKYSTDFIEGIDSAATVISRQGLRVENNDQVLVMIKAFADLVHFRLHRKGSDSCTIDSAFIYKYKTMDFYSKIWRCDSTNYRFDFSHSIQKSEGCWLISLPLEVGVAVPGYYDRFDFRITEKGVITILSRCPLCFYILKVE